MSWYVQRVILDKELLREEILSAESSLFASDLHNDIVVIEDAIVELSTVTERSPLQVLTHYEVALLGIVSKYGGNFSELQRLLGRQRDTIKTHFENACYKIGYWLAGHYTDEGYVDYVWERNKLIFINAGFTKDDVEARILDYMVSKYKHTISRTGLDTYE